MKLPNSYGSICKMKGNRRKSWRVRVTSEIQFNEETKQYRQIQKTIGYYSSRSEAIKALADYNDHPFNLDYMSVTFDQCYQQAQKSFTDSRRNNYVAAYKYLEPLKDIPIRHIKTSQMQRCIDSCTTTQQVEIKTVCHKIFDYALRNEIVDRDPSRYLHSVNKNPSRDREILTAEQIAGIDGGSEWWQKIITILLYSGMRTKELKTLDPDWIDTENGILDIRLAKNKSSLRKIPIHSHVLPLFYDYKAAGCNLYGYTHDGLNKALKTFCGHTAHDCRHTFTTRMRQCGCDPLVLQLLLGHTPTTITERVYTHITIEELSSALECLNYDT